MSADSTAGYKPPAKPGDPFQGSLQLIRIRGQSDRDWETDVPYATLSPVFIVR